MGKLQNPYQTWEAAEPRLREIITKIGKYPSSRDLYRLNENSLRHAIETYHGGSYVVRDRMKIAQVKVCSGTWQDLDQVITKLLEIKKIIGHFPTAHELYELGYSGLSSAISNKLGGFQTIRDLLAEETIRQPKGKWSNIEAVNAKLREIAKELGYFPRIVDLKARHLNGLIRAISTQFGGFHKVAKLLGYKPTRHLRGYWNVWENVEAELQILIDKLGHFPNPDEFNNEWTLRNRIGRHGGFAVVREKMGYGPITDTYLSTHANDLAQIVIELGVPTDRFWSVMKERWVVLDLTTAIEKFKQTKSLDLFQALLDS